MADQDDEWRPGKLAALLDGLGEAQLVYSDARVVGRGALAAEVTASLAAARARADSA